MVRRKKEKKHSGGDGGAADTPSPSISAASASASAPTGSKRKVGFVEDVVVVGETPAADGGEGKRVKLAD